MLTYYVFHRVITADFIQINDLDEIVFPTGKHWHAPDRNRRYRCVAVVKANTFDDVFDLTNDGNDNGQVEYVSSKDDMRSTSIGDVIVTDNGEAYLVGPNDLFIDLRLSPNKIRQMCGLDDDEEGSDEPAPNPKWLSEPLKLVIYPDEEELEDLSIGWCRREDDPLPESRGADWRSEKLSDDSWHGNLRRLTRRFSRW